MTVCGIGHPAPIAMLCLVAGATPALGAGDGGNAQKAAASVFRDNPRQSDPALELQRLRNEGVALYESGIALDQALATFEAAFALSGQAADAFNVALVHFRQNDSRTARRWLRRALAQDSDFPNAHYLLGVLARSDGDFPAARQSWERALKLAPGDSHLHYQLALLARSDRDASGFLQHLVDALALDPDNTAALYQMYRHYQTSGNRELARDTMARFNTLKQQEKFSRREKSKDPSKLARPVLAATTDARGFQVITVAPRFTVSTVDPGCRAVAADGYVTLAGDTPKEGLALACNDGRLRGMAYGTQPSFVDLGQAPTDTQFIRLEWLDDAGPRVLALTDTGLSMASAPVGGGGDYAQVLTAAAAPLVLVDLEADGDVDIAAGGGQAPLTNTGQAEFVQEDVHRHGPLTEALAGATATAVADLDRDGLSDLLILKDNSLTVAQGAPTGFTAALTLPTGAGAVGLVVGDFSNDGGLDVALLRPGSVGWLWNLDPRHPATPTPLDLDLDLDPPRWMTATDYNNDGLLDLLVVADDGQAVLLRNQGRRRFTEQALGDWPPPAAGARLISGDFDQDGREDLAYVTAAGGLALARNATKGVGNTIAVFAHGVRAAPSGLLTQIEVRRGGAYAYAQSAGGVRRLGIGAADYVEILRLEWTNGFVENKLKIDATDTVYTFTESERISGSCPSLFVWNGERFDYFTDAFISGPMGVPLDRGVYFPVNDRELIAIPGEQARLRHGRLDIRFTEELHETVFLDRVRLRVVDHPQGSEVLPHSRLVPAPPPATAFYASGQPIAAARATGSHGGELTAALAEVDGIHADFLTRAPHVGFAEPHWIELTLPPGVDPAAVDALLATGWFYYFESTSMIAQAQSHGPHLPWPWIDQYVDGAWREVAPLGIPSGKGKTAVAPLKGQLRSRRLRIRSGVAVYWDRIAFSLEQSALSVRTEAPLTEATLRFRGFSELVARDPERFDYHAVGYSALWSPMAGRYTAYGPVESLLAAADGRYAVFGSGDEIAFSFQVDAPPPSDTHQRTYLLELVGYVKDGDRYTAHPRRVEPLPYLGLNQYPPPRDQRLDRAQTHSPHRSRAPLDFTLTAIGSDPPEAAP